jgi:hypothetical protein
METTRAGYDADPPELVGRSGGMGVSEMYLNAEGVAPDPWGAELARKRARATATPRARRPGLKLVAFALSAYFSLEESK